MQEIEKEWLHENHQGYKIGAMEYITCSSIKIILSIYYN